MSADRCINSALVVPDTAVYDRRIDPPDRMYLQLLCNALMGDIILTDHQRSGCVHIDPVHDSRTHHAVDPGQLLAAMIH